MGSAAASRRVALSLLSESRRRGARIRDLMRGSRALTDLPPRDRALATRLALGATAARGTLDARIDAHRSSGRLEPRVRDALRLGAFELMYLATPGAVAVDQGVELVRGVAPRAAGLANAVLRRVCATDRPAVAAARGRVEAGDADEADLALVAGLPAWLVSALVRSLGVGAALRLAPGVLEPPPVFVAANLARHAPDEARSLLEHAGLRPEGTPLPWAFRLAEPADLARSGLVGSVDVLPCDLSAQLVACVAAPAGGGSLLEVGCGRGTKTILAAGLARRSGARPRVLAVDVDPHKADLARARVGRSGLAGEVAVTALDGRELGGAAPRGVADAYDVVFLDAPCSGAGTLRRHPETAWGLEARSLSSDGDGLPRLQLDLLKAASARVARAGSLVYATCSPLVEEDEDVVRAFLASGEGQGFSVAPPLESGGPLSWAQAAPAVGRATTADGFLRTTGELGEDLHFACRLTRAR